MSLTSVDIRKDERIFWFIYSLGVKGLLELLTPCCISLFNVSNARNKTIISTEDRDMCCQLNILFVTTTCVQI